MKDYGNAGIVEMSLEAVLKRSLEELSLVMLGKSSIVQMGETI